MFDRSIAVAAGLLVAAVSPAAAQTFESAYTDLDTDKCRHKPGKEVEDYGSWHCRGYAGIPVWVSAGDQRMLMSFGRNADDQPAASQTFPNFNNVYKARIEWRLVKEPKRKPAPFAAIVRWNIMIDQSDKPSEARGRVLVVTRLGDDVCHVGYVDALANKDANALARELADKHARTFDCDNDKRIILGTQGDSVAGMAGEIEREAEEKAKQKTAPEKK